ncbi:DNA repair protein [Thalassorhabdomicrobium marinisediminis]|uniref:DNA repair protein n=1 Tax=Thalassorhabdomicrobium marinisediminis TaxID=2170577 RepID=UPI002491BCE3|nr:DNA repair protein [Thalassorhabdomicrobium marinisediminis]
MSSKSLVVQAHRTLHLISVFLMGLIALGAVALTLASAFGVIPWLTFTATFGDLTFPEAGMITQIGLTVILASLFLFMPSVGRVMALERSHRDFTVSMNDVARAYHMCHTADRAGVFTLSSEFDAVRERLAYLRDHPQLDSLEPAVLELAAQMSQQARELADVYNDEKVARAKTFLKQRQEEAERQQDLIVEAHHALRDIRKWSQQVELEESVVASQLSQLEEALESTLPALGYTLGKESAEIVKLPQKPAAE